MTIKRKNIRPSGLLEVEADNTDTVDTNGFSDAIQAVGAETAKFSGGATMQANSGLRIGMTQLKIVTIGATPGFRVEVPADFIGWTATGVTVDNNNTTLTNTTLIGTPPEAVVDYGSIDTRDIALVTRLTATRTEFGSGTAFLNYEISDDGVVFTVPVTTPTQFQFLNITATGDMGGTIPIDTGIVTFNDPNPQTFRFVKIIGGSTGSQTQVGFIYQFTEQDPGGNTVTVRVRSSDTINTADGTVIITDQVMNENETLTFDTDLLLTGNPSGDFVTLEIVSLAGFDIPTTLSEITSIKEV